MNSNGSSERISGDGALQTLHKLASDEQLLQENTLSLVASSSWCVPRVRELLASPFANLTAEGYPGARFHPGTRFADVVEKLAVSAATEVFQAKYANVQPHSGTTANLAVMLALLKPGDTILGMRIDSGGHLSHGAFSSFSGKLFKPVGYGLSAGWIDYQEVARLAQVYRPKLIICGASSYPRSIDFNRFRSIADSVGAFLLADISHISGLVVAGLHQNPVNSAHVTTTSTYKQLFGPRGGLILAGEDHAMRIPGSRNSLAEALQSAVFPLSQGTPDLGNIAAKAGCLALSGTQEFRQKMQTVLELSKHLASSLTRRGYALATGGTDTHMVLVDLRPLGLPGNLAENALESVGILVNRNLVDQDSRGPKTTSGIRLGTNSAAHRGLTTTVIEEVAHIIDLVLRCIRVGEDPLVSPSVLKSAKESVVAICKRYPLEN